LVQVSGFKLQGMFVNLTSSFTISPFLSSYQRSAISFQINYTNYKLISFTSHFSLKLSAFSLYEKGFGAATVEKIALYAAK
jgi:hypothetical protein